MTPLEQYADLPSELPHTGGVPVRGLAVLCSGRTEFNQPAIAVWHIALSGAFTGAWVLPQAQVDETDAARLALLLLERRALLAWDPEPPLSLLAGLIHAAGLPADTANPWEEHLCRVSDALSQIRRARAAHVAALEDQPKAAPLHWKLALPVTDPAALADFLPAVRRAAPRSVAPVTYNALELATVARWCLHAWQETERVRLRRPVLCQQFGPEQPAAPTWIAALRAQNSQKLKFDDHTSTSWTVPLDPKPKTSSSVSQDRDDCRRAPGSRTVNSLPKSASDALLRDEGAMSAAGFASFRRVLTWPGNDVHLVGGNRVLALLADQPGSELAPATCVLRESWWTR